MLFAVYLLPLLLIELTTAHNVYMLVFPKTIRPGMRFDCHVTRESKYPRLSMNATIRTYRTTIVSQTFNIAEKDQLISLQIPDNMTTDSYRFEVKAADRFGTQQIFQTGYLSFDAKRLSVFIQTDKAIYKPGQSVQFRVLAINAELDVLKRTMDIDIFDPSRNRISLWRNVTAESGVFQGEMVMSDQPPLGDWIIEVLYDRNEKITKRFTVEEFVLPKFEVSLSTQASAVMTDEYLTGSVSAKYTIGKGVEGSGTLIIKKKYLGYKETEKKYSLSFQEGLHYATL